MNKKEKRIRILDLQDQHCRKCGNAKKPLKICIKCCEIGKELDHLGREILDMPPRVLNNREKWDDICKKAAVLYEKGLKPSRIAELLGCHRNTLRGQLKKRGLWRGQSSAVIQEQARRRWDDLCELTLQFREKGLSYPKIAAMLEVPASNLRREMDKRGIR